MWFGGSETGGDDVRNGRQNDLVTGFDSRKLGLEGTTVLSAKFVVTAIILTEVVIVVSQFEGVGVGLEHRR